MRNNSEQIRTIRPGAGKRPGTLNIEIVHRGIMLTDYFSTPDGDSRIPIRVKRLRFGASITSCPLSGQ